MPDNRSMPTATIIPVLGYDDVAGAVSWLCTAFGFVERLRIGDHRAQLTYGPGAVVVTGRGGGAPAVGDHSIMVRVADAEAHCARAAASGARIVQPPTDFPYGERQYTALDVGGHAWTFSQTVMDIDPAAWGGRLLEPGGVAGGDDEPEIRRIAAADERAAECRLRRQIARSARDRARASGRHRSPGGEGTWRFARRSGARPTGIGRR